MLFKKRPPPPARPVTTGLVAGELDAAERALVRAVEEWVSRELGAAWQVVLWRRDESSGSQTWTAEAIRPTPASGGARIVIASPSCRTLPEALKGLRRAVLDSVGKMLEAGG